MYPAIRLALMTVGCAAGFGLARTITRLRHARGGRAIGPFRPTVTRNGTHVHHFVWGLVLMAVAGVAGAFDVGVIRSPAALLLGVGLGIVVDETSLFVYMDPESYEHPVNTRMGIAVVAALAALTAIALVAG